MKRLVAEITHLLVKEDRPPLVNSYTQQREIASAIVLKYEPYNNQCLRRMLGVCFKSQNQQNKPLHIQDGKQILPRLTPARRTVPATKQAQFMTLTRNIFSSCQRDFESETDKPNENTVEHVFRSRTAMNSCWNIMNRLTDLTRNSKVLMQDHIAKPELGDPMLDGKMKYDKQIRIKGLDKMSKTVIRASHSTGHRQSQQFKGVEHNNVCSVWLDNSIASVISMNWVGSLSIDDKPVYEICPADRMSCIPPTNACIKAALKEFMQMDENDIKRMEMSKSVYGILLPPNARCEAKPNNIKQVTNTLLWFHHSMNKISDIQTSILEIVCGRAKDKWNDLLWLFNEVKLYRKMPMLHITLNTMINVHHMIPLNYRENYKFGADNVHHWYPDCNLDKIFSVLPFVIIAWYKRLKPSNELVLKHNITH